jgi:hypothetical protein
MVQVIKAAEKESVQQPKLYCFPSLLFSKNAVPARLRSLEHRFEKVELGNSRSLKEFGAPGHVVEVETACKHPCQSTETIGGCTPADSIACEQSDVNVSDRRKMESVLAVFQKAVCELEQLREQVAENSEKAILALAMAVARKVVQSEVENNPDLTLATIRKALQKIKNTDKVCIKVNPEDLQKVRNARNSISDVSGQQVHLSVEADDRVSRGGCILETDMGDFDARLESQVQVIEEAFFAPRQSILEENPGS